MKKRVAKGIAAALCVAMLALAAATVMAPGMETAAASDRNPVKVEKADQKTAVAELKAMQIGKNLSADQQNKINSVLTEAYSKIGYKGGNLKVEEDNSYDDCAYTLPELNAYVANAKAKINEIINPPANNEGGGNGESEAPAVPANADHFLMVGGNWVTPVANAGQTVSLVLPVVNMGKTMVTNAVVTPALNIETKEWPFEITNSNYSQTISDLPGTDTGLSDMDRRRELTWNLKTRSDVGNGYQKISFQVRYRASDGTSQSATLDTYVQLCGTAGVGADGKASVPRVIVTGFETEPATVHAGESFLLTLHLKNTSTATSVQNMVFEIVAAAEGKDADTTYAAFLPTAGSSTIFVDRIGKEGTKDIRIEMEAKADLAQKPYALNVNMNYEDERVNAYTNTTSVSVPVKQKARVDISEPQVMPPNIEVGNEANIMCSIYNMGKTKLYNVQVKTQGDSVSGGDAFVGNLDSGATGAVDVYVTGKQATMDDGVIKLLISYEDETGEATVIEKEASLFVSETMMGDMAPDDMMIEEEKPGNKAGAYIAAIVGVLALAGAAAVIWLKRKKKKEQMSLEDDLMDIDENDSGQE